MQLAIKENEARVAVEMAFNPESEGFNQEIIRLLGGKEEDESK